MKKGRVLKKISERSRLVKIIYAIIIAFAVISFWRGTWGLMDEFLFPNNLFLSHTTSIIIGLIILYFTKHIFDELL